MAVRTAGFGGKPSPPSPTPPSVSSFYLFLAPLLSIFLALHLCCEQPLLSPPLICFRSASPRSKSFGSGFFLSDLLAVSLSASSEPSACSLLSDLSSRSSGVGCPVPLSLFCWAFPLYDEDLLVFRSSLSVSHLSCYPLISSRKSLRIRPVLVSCSPNRLIPSSSFSWFFLPSENWVMFSNKSMDFLALNPLKRFRDFSPLILHQSCWMVQLTKDTLIRIWLSQKQVSLISFNFPNLSSFTTINERQANAHLFGVYIYPTKFWSVRHVQIGPLPLTALLKLIYFRISSFLVTAYYLLVFYGYTVSSPISVLVALLLCEAESICLKDRSNLWYGLRIITLRPNTNLYIRITIKTNSYILKSDFAKWCRNLINSLVCVMYFWYRFSLVGNPLFIYLKWTTGVFISLSDNVCEKMIFFKITDLFLSYWYVVSRIFFTSDLAWMFGVKTLMVLLSEWQPASDGIHLWFFWDIMKLQIAYVSYLWFFGTTGVSRLQRSG